MPTWLLVVLILAGIALVQVSLRRALLAPLRGLVWLADRAAAWLNSLGRRLAAAAGRRLTETELDNGRFKVSYVVSGVTSTGACLLFLGAEGLTIALSLEALGLAAVHLPPAIQHVDAILTGSLLLAGVFGAFAAHSLAAGPSLLVVKHWHSPTALIALRRIAMVAFALVLAATIGLGTLRARELVLSNQVQTVATVDMPSSGETAPQPSADTDALVTAVRYVVSVAGAAALMLVSAVAWELGPAQMVPLLSLLLIWGLVPPVGLTRWITRAISALARAALSLLAHLVDMIMAVATLLVRAPVELARTIHNWAVTRENGDHRAHPVRATLASLSSVAWDMQVPVRPGAWMATNTPQTELE